MGINHLLKSTIRPVQGLLQKEPEKSPVNIEKTAFYIEQIDLPSDIGSYGQRQIFSLMRALLRGEPLPVLSEEHRLYLEIAKDLVTQIRAQQAIKRSGHVK